MKEIEILERNIGIPISELNFKDKQVELVLNGKTIGFVAFLRQEDQILFDFSEESLSVINMQLVYESEHLKIKPLVEDFIKRSDFQIISEDFPTIKIVDQEGNFLYSAECMYENSVWKLTHDINFELDKRENEIKSLRSKLNQNTYNIQQNNYLEYQNRMVDKVMDKGVELFSIWMENQSINEKQEIELVNEFEKQELDVVNKLDKRDKYFKGLIVGTCLILMGVLAYFDKVSAVLPIIGVVIGIVLQSDSISKYFTGSAKKNSSNTFMDD